MPAALDRINRMNRIFLGMRLHFLTTANLSNRANFAWVDDRPGANLTLHIHSSQFKRSAPFPIINSPLLILNSPEFCRRRRLIVPNVAPLPHPASLFYQQQPN